MYCSMYLYMEVIGENSDEKCVYYPLLHVAHIAVYVYLSIFYCSLKQST